MKSSNWKTLNCIVFDLGGVLIDWNPRYLYRELFNGNDVEMEYFLTRVCSPEWNALQDAGRPFAKAIEERISAFPQYESLISVYFARWTEMIGGSIAGTVEVLSEVRKHGYRLFALSNWSAETFPLGVVPMLSISPISDIRRCEDII